MEGEAIFSAQFSPPFPEGRQIWETGTGPAQTAASSWLWQGEILTLGCWLPGPSCFPSDAGPGHWKGENVRARPCQQLLTTLTRPF